MFSAAVSLKKEKKTRTIFTTDQLRQLEAEFWYNNMYLTSAKRKELVRRLDLTELQISMWFQNRRSKWKKEARNRNSPKNSYKTCRHIIGSDTRSSSLSPSSHNDDAEKIHSCHNQENTTSLELSKQPNLYDHQHSNHILQPTSYNSRSYEVPTDNNGYDLSYSSKHHNQCNVDSFRETFDLYNCLFEYWSTSSCAYEVPQTIIFMNTIILQHGVRKWNNCSIYVSFSLRMKKCFLLFNFYSFKTVNIVSCCLPKISIWFIVVSFCDNFGDFVR